MSKRNKDDIAALQERVEVLEQQIAGLLGLEYRPVTPGAFGHPPPKESLTASKFLRDILPALGRRANSEAARLLVVAMADQEGALGGGPVAVQNLAVDEAVRPLAGLGTAISHVSRLKMLQALLLHQECTTTELAEISGASGGNLYQHLNELNTANLIFQPSRGHYRLTPGGQWTVALLFFVARQPSNSWLNQWNEEKPRASND